MGLCGEVHLALCLGGDMLLAATDRCSTLCVCILQINKIVCYNDNYINYAVLQNDLFLISGGSSKLSPLVQNFGQKNIPFFSNVRAAGM